MRTGSNAVEATKASVGGDGLRVREQLPRLVGQGYESLTNSEKDLLKWVGVFFRKPTPGKFMMRLRMPNGFTSSIQLRAIADLSRRLGNCVLDITTRQQIQLRGFELGSVTEIWEKLRGVDLYSLQTGMDNVRNISGCALSGLTLNELFDASLVVAELDTIQHNYHGLCGELHARRVAGRGAGAGDAPGPGGIQCAGRRQDGIGRVHHCVSAGRVRMDSEGGTTRRGAGGHIPRSWAAGCALEVPLRLPD
jgi:hypothetical protein